MCKTRRIDIGQERWRPQATNGSVHILELAIADSHNLDLAEIDAGKEAILAVEAALFALP